MRVNKCRADIHSFIYNNYTLSVKTGGRGFMLVPLATQ